MQMTREKGWHHPTGSWLSKPVQIREHFRGCAKKRPLSNARGSLQYYLHLSVTLTALSCGEISKNSSTG
eukprot:3293916-Prymnesium_polylepis.1